MNPDDCQFAVLTPQGRGAIATLAVRGRRAVERVAGRFRPRSGKPFAAIPPGAVAVGYWTSGAGAAADEVVVCRTAAEEVEIHCHGGRAAVAAIADSLLAAGCRPMDWQQWLRLQEPEPFAAAARIDLASADTTRTAAILLDQYRGALLRELDAIASLLSLGAQADALTRLEILLGRVPLGRRLTAPWRVVLAGRPNVGKSSLLNALLGYRRAIVNPQPGTTRDILTGLTAIDGWPMELCDTAGLRTSEDALETMGIARAVDHWRKADLVVAVFDRSQPWLAADEAFLASLPTTLVAHNKCDLPADAAPRPPGYRVSALTGEGVDALLEGVSRRLVPDPPSPGQAVPFRVEHAVALEEATVLARKARLSDAAERIAQLVKTGR